MLTFENLDSFADEIFIGKRNGKRYRLVGKFVGYDGKQYVALVTTNMWADKNYLTFDNFCKSYVFESDMM